MTDSAGNKIVTEADQSALAHSPCQATHCKPLVGQRVSLERRCYRSKKNSASVRRAVRLLVAAPRKTEGFSCSVGTVPSGPGTAGFFCPPWRQQYQLLGNLGLDAALGAYQKAQLGLNSNWSPSTCSVPLIPAR